MTWIRRTGFVPCATRKQFESWALARFRSTVNVPNVSAFELKHAGLTLGARRRAIRAAFGSWAARWDGYADALASAHQAWEGRR